MPGVVNIRKGRSAGAGAVAAGLLLAAPLLTSCGIVPGTSGCEPASIEVAEAAASTGDEPFALTARLTSGGEPVAGADLDFYLVRSRDGEDQAPEYDGTRTTDADGLAERRYEGGSEDILASTTETLESYWVAYDANGDIDGTEYCGTDSEPAAIDVPCVGFGCRW